jgi:glycosyltransferase involved in cell wall biosynthesis
VESGRPLRIAVVAPPFYELPPDGYGGIERVCWSLAEGLVDRGHDVTLVGAGPSRTRARFVATFAEAQQEGVESETLTEVLHAARAAAALEELELDLVHDHTRAGLLGAAARRVPTLATVHAPVAGPESQAPLYEALSRWISLAALSEAQRRAAPGLPWAGTVPNGIAVDDFPFRADKQDFLLYLGRMSPQKGVHVAIRAAREAGRRLVIAGAPTIASERAYFEEQVRPSLGDGVEWVGEVAGEARTSLLARAACLLFPIAWDEPFGLVLVEALACGTPVVALRAGSVPEIVADGETGFVRDAPDELADAIRALASIDPARCRAVAAERFGVEAMVAGYEALYRRLLHR